jgi:hypothetical protein
MDADFVREIVVLAVFIGLYVVGSALLLRGHTTDLSAVHDNGSARRAAAGGADPQRLNRRRKAIAREQAERGQVEQQSTGDELDDA